MFILYVDYFSVSYVIVVITQLGKFLKKIRLLTWGLITEQKPKSVPKKGRKLVVFLDNFSEPNLKYKEK